MPAASSRSTRPETLTNRVIGSTKANSLKSPAAMTAAVGSAVRICWMKDYAVVSTKR